MIKSLPLVTNSAVRVKKEGKFEGLTYIRMSKIFRYRVVAERVIKTEDKQTTGYSPGFCHLERQEK